MSTTLETDICILGGGIAGLWLNARLRQLGYSTLLVERGALGGGQSVKSQGIIHGGTKYALNGKLSSAAEAIAGMPERWRASREPASWICRGYACSPSTIISGRRAA